MECKSTSIPFLDDMYLFLLDQKAWLKVKYIPNSQKLCRLGNHSMTVIVDDDNRERILIFGGINEANGSSGLSNQVITAEILQIN